MSDFFLSNREVRRVPLDFDAPLQTVWEGYSLPESLRPTACPTCGPPSRDAYFYGDGLTPEARAVESTFYRHQIDGPNADALAWCDKLGQAEVDNLLAQGRLQTWGGRSLPTHGNPCGRGFWLSLPRTAAEINELNRRPGLDSHDGINRSILVRFRCERLGIKMACPTCGGEGYVFASDADRAAYEAWEPTDPPSGEGFQVWETTTEGSPITPVFATTREMAEHAALHCSLAGGTRVSVAQWLRVAEGALLVTDLASNRAVVS